MENKLDFRTKPMYVCIDKYKAYSFDYNGWIIFDDYVVNERSPRHSRYSICITSPSITNTDELNDYSLQGQKIANMVTELIPICGLPSLNSSLFVSFYSNLEIADYKSSPRGWSSNYKSILSSLETDNGKKNKLTVTMEGFIHTSMLEQSPLYDIQLMMEHYDDAEDPIKFLLFLNKCILSANDINVYLLIGKAIEIINALYPYKKHQKSKDRRIEKHFPELLDAFQDVTIEKLLSWSNNRKETRHYNDNKNENLPHEPLSKEERIALYRCSNSLIINVIRNSFGLPHLSVESE